MNSKSCSGNADLNRGRILLLTAAALWSLAVDESARIAAAQRARTFTSAGGALFYLAWGRKANGRDG